jgi:2,3-dihydroxy-p-cumate/2,3-dihydroxybenzoate 3,4-dioxygenase
MPDGLRALREYVAEGGNDASVPVTRLGYVALGVPEPHKSRAFYEDSVGLTVTLEADDRLHFTCDERKQAVVLVQAAEPALAHIALEIGVDLKTAADRLVARGVGVRWGDPDEANVYGLDDYLELEAPEGVPFRLYNVMQRIGQPPKKDFVHFDRLGHIGLGFDDLPSAFRFFTETFDLKISDYIGDRTAFMRCDSYHHSLVITQRRGKVLHHVAFMVEELDDIGRAFHRLNHNGVPITFGPGRHPTSTSIFLYFESPDGFGHEYSFGMKQITDANHRPRVFEPRPESVCLWGSRSQGVF